MNPAVSRLALADVLIGTAEPVEWLIPQFLAQGSLVVLAGDAGVGKSFLTYTLSLSLAALGRRIVYFDQENSRPDCIQYLRWAWHGLNCPSIETVAELLYFAPFQLGSSSWEARAAAIISPHQPALLVFDTATPCCDIRDENDNAEASHVILAIRRLQALSSPPATALVLKHAKVLTEHRSSAGYDRTIRGAKAWLGAADSVIFHVGPRGRPRHDGLMTTHLEPWKARAFGLRTRLSIVPAWTPTKDGLALWLSASDSETGRVLVPGLFSTSFSPSK